MKNIIVTARDGAIAEAISKRLKSGYRVEWVADKQHCLDKLRQLRFDLVFIDIEVLIDSDPGKNAKIHLQPFRQIYPTVAIIIMTDWEHIRHAVMAVKGGANDYVTYPINPEEVDYVIENAQESLIVQSEIDYLRDQFWQNETLDLIRTRSVPMKAVFDRIRSVAETRSTVLLTGETGTGKSVLAHLIHQHSQRRENQFISVHCGAVPDTLLESELFGHEKGAFTGAVRRKLGKFEIARGGTLFLDEVGTISASAQIKLLRVLQDGTFQRVGGEESQSADVRVIAATNADLKQMCADGQFRNDLYYRLNVFPIELPPLRQRTEDLPLLLEGFLNKLNQFNSKNISGVHPHVLQAFRNYDWPGNIREMENLVERAYILETSELMSPESFPVELFEEDATYSDSASSGLQTLESYRRRALGDIERQYLDQALAQCHGKINATAAAAGISTRQLHKLMKKYGLRKEDFK